METPKESRGAGAELARHAARALRYVRHRGVVFTVRRLITVVRPERLAGFDSLRARIAGKKGIEIGGPSDIFRDGGILPLYAHVGALDGCNFAEQTMWEGQVKAGQTYRVSEHRPAGRQLISEASDLAGVGDGEYDFLLSSHCLEHVANPLKALREWTRVVKPGGAMVVVVPDPRHTFDRRRPITPFPHLVSDFEAGIGEDDLTHLPEILSLNDPSLDDEAGDPAVLAARAADNFRSRGMHHHVFDPALIKRALEWAALRVLEVQVFLPAHIVAVAEKPA
jgi:SAM-dependent methyltransferase